VTAINWGGETGLRRHLNKTGPYRSRILSSSTDCDHNGRGFFESLEDAGAIEVRKAEIEKKDVDIVSSQQVERPQSVRGVDDDVTLLSQNLDGGLPQSLIVLDDQHGGPSTLVLMGIDVYRHPTCVRFSACVRAGRPLW
jgi:hypothetical protein